MMRGADVVLDHPRFDVDTVLHRVEQLAGEIDRAAVSQMAARRQRKAHQGIARFHQRHVDGGVRLRAAAHALVVEPGCIHGGMPGGFEFHP